MIKKIIVFVFFLSVLLVYFHNLTRDVYSGDIGDLVTAAYVGGVPHPPGYPLFTLLGFILSHLPISLPVVSRVGLISVFSSLAALILFYKYTRRVTKSVFLGLLSTSILAFSYFFWIDAEIPEVFTLNSFFAIALFYCSVKFYENKKIYYFYWIALLSGLSLAHHPTIIFVFPSILILGMKHVKFIFSKKIKLFFSLFIFLLGLSVYLYIPIAASRNPPINWDNAINLKNFLHLILRKDYSYKPSVSSGVPPEIVLIILKSYFKTLLHTFSYQGLFLFFLGFLALLKKNKRILLALGIAYILSGPFFVAYGATPTVSSAYLSIMERFYLLSYTILSFFIPYGFAMIKDFLDSKFSAKFLSMLLLSYFLIIPIFLFYYNFPKTDVSKTQIGNNLARNILNSLPHNSVLFVSGDTNTFNVWHAHYVLKEREDIDIITPPGTTGNLFLDKEINSYKRKFPKTKLNEIVAKVFEKILKRREMYTTYEVTQLPKDIMFVPMGLVNKIMYKKDFWSKDQYLEYVEKTLHKIKLLRRDSMTLAEKNFISIEIPNLYANAFVNVGNFIDSHFKDPSTAQGYYRRALWINENNPLAYSGLAITQYKADHDCTNSLNNLQTAISIYPVWEKFYIQLYYLYNKCAVNKNLIKDFENKYQSIFRKNIKDQVRL